MHLDDDGDDDAPVFGAPLPPEDRLWRHPSEMAFVSGNPATSRSAPTLSGGRMLGVAVVSGLVGAVLAVGVVAASVGLGSDPDSAPPTSSSITASLVSQNGGESGASVATRLAPTLARVLVGATPTVGSAIVLRRDGYLLTDASLLAGATSVTVSLGGESLPATVVGTDPLTDVAVLHVAKTDLHAAPFGTDSTPTVGDRAFVVGATGAGAPAVTAGVISVLDRKVTMPAGNVLHGMTQTDAPVDSDAIGGALADSGGIVVGLVSGPASATGGYAVPIATAMTAADDIITVGHARHVWLGVEGTDLDGDGASSLHVVGGAAITKVADGSPAAVAGLQGGDVITAVGGTPVRSMSDLVVGLRAHDPGETVDVEYWRDGERHSCKATLTERGT